MFTDSQLVFTSLHTYLSGYSNRLIAATCTKQAYTHNLVLVSSLDKNLSIDSFRKKKSRQATWESSILPKTSPRQIYVVATCNNKSTVPGLRSTTPEQPREVVKVGSRS